MDSEATRHEILASRARLEKWVPFDNPSFLTVPELEGLLEAEQSDE
jgi:hypothetical protein